MFKMGNQDRDSMNSQMGYVTAKLEGLDTYIREHMKTEEAKFSAINKTISLQRRYLVGLTLLTVMSQSGLPLDKVIMFLVKLI